MTVIFDPRAGKDEIHSLLHKAPLDIAQGSEVFALHLPGFGARIAIHGFMNQPSQPFVSQDGRFHAFAQGELYDTPWGTTSLSGLLNHFCQSGVNGWQRVNGQFVFVVYDQQERKLHVINDRLAFHRTYYSVQGDTFLLGTRIKDILPLLPKGSNILPLGVAQLILFGLQHGTGTLFQGIDWLPPASMLCFDGATLSRQRYWRPIYQPDPHVTTDELIDHLGRAVRRQVPGGGRKGVLLSGGLDSRVVAREASLADSSMQAFTFGDEDSRDVQYARRICDRLDVEHHHLRIEPTKWKHTLRDIVWQVEGEAVMHHFRSVQFHPYLKSHCDSLLTGVLGDVIMGKFVKADKFRRVPKHELLEMAFDHALKHPLDSVQRIFHANRWPQLLEESRGILSKTVDEHPNELAMDTLTSWIIAYRLPRYVFIGAAADRCLFNPRSPFCDYDLLDFPLKVPANLRLCQALYVKALWKMMPELRHVPWQKTGQPADPNPARAWVRGRAAKAGRSIRALMGTKPPQSYKKSYMHLGDLIRKSFHQEELIGLLCRPEQRWHGVINPRMVENIVDEHFASPNDHGSLISKFLTLHYTEQLFLG